MLKACLNGDRPASEWVPVTATVLADGAAAAVAAGAEAVHLHPRNDLGRETLGAQAHRETLAAMRAAVPGVRVSSSSTLVRQALTT